MSFPNPGNGRPLKAMVRIASFARTTAMLDTLRAVASAAINPNCNRILHDEVILCASRVPDPKPPTLLERLIGRPSYHLILARLRKIWQENENGGGDTGNHRYSALGPTQRVRRALRFHGF